MKRQNELKISKMNDVIRLEKEKEFLEVVLQETNEPLERFKPVKSYLETVREASHGEFRSIRELFDAYDALSNERAEMTTLDLNASELVAGRHRQLDMLNSVSLFEFSLC